MKQFFKLIDIFPENFTLSLNGKGPKKSLNGGLFTFLSLFSWIIITIYLITQFIDNRKVTLIYQEQTEKNMLPQPVKPSDLEMTFSIWQTENFTQYPFPLEMNFMNEVRIDALKIISGNNATSQF